MFRPAHLPSAPQPRESRRPGHAHRWRARATAAPSLAHSLTHARFAQHIIVSSPAASLARLASCPCFCLFLSVPLCRHMCRRQRWQSGGRAAAHDIQQALRVRARFCYQVERAVHCARAPLHAPAPLPFPLRVPLTTLLASSTLAASSQPQARQQQPASQTHAPAAPEGTLARLPQLAPPLPARQTQWMGWRRDGRDGF